MPMQQAKYLNQNHPFLSSRLALKGGTAIHLFHLDGLRLSVDIDLNYIGQIDREKMLKEKPIIEDALQKICLSLGYGIQRRPTEHAGGKWRLNYLGHNQQSQNLEVDVNFLYRLSIWKTEIKPIRIFKKFEMNSKFPIVSTLELWAGKMTAAITRSEPRDLYDINLIPEKVLETEFFRSTVLLFASASRKDLREIKLINWEPSSEKQFLERLFPVLRSSEKLNPKSIVTKAREIMAPFLKFKKQEGDYLNRLIEEGDYQPELIFSDEQLAKRLRQHPVVLWKAVNVREHERQDT